MRSAVAAIVSWTALKRTPNTRRGGPAIVVRRYRAIDAPGASLLKSELLKQHEYVFAARAEARGCLEGAARAHASRARPRPRRRSKMASFDCRASERSKNRRLPRDDGARHEATGRAGRTGAPGRDGRPRKKPVAVGRRPAPPRRRRRRLEVARAAVRAALLRQGRRVRHARARAVPHRHGARARGGRDLLVPRAHSAKVVRDLLAALVGPRGLDPVPRVQRALQLRVVRPDGPGHARVASIQRARGGGGRRRDARARRIGRRGRVVARARALRLGLRPPVRRAQGAAVALRPRAAPARFASTASRDRLRSATRRAATATARDRRSRRSWS